MLRVFYCRRLCFIYFASSVSNTSKNGDRECEAVKSYKDCTDEIKDWAIKHRRSLEFEYGSWDKYFLMPGEKPIQGSILKPIVGKFKVLADRRICWRLEDCGADKVCIRNSHSKWRNYYIYLFFKFLVLSSSRNCNRIL